MQFKFGQRMVSCFVKSFIILLYIGSFKGKTYLYAEDQFWRYNETSHKMDPGYPKHMGRWRGVPVNIDAATTWKDG